MKKHFEENKKFYIGIACGVALAGITWLIVKERRTILLGGMDALSTAESSTTTRSFNFLTKNSGNTVTVVHTGMRGHPGFSIRNTETGIDFYSQAEAARHFDIPQSVLSSHLNKGTPLKENLHFERIQSA